MTSDAPPFGIAARFPFGTYRGYSGGVLEPWPRTTRLYDALTNAAGVGSTAVLDGDTLAPSVEARAALSWLEQNPPDHLHLPCAPAPGGRGKRSHKVAAWRAEGLLTIPKGGTRPQDRKTLRSVASTPLAGAVGWIWNVAPPEEVRHTLEALAADVAYLGEAESIAVVELLALESTHHRVDQATAFAPPRDGVWVSTPVAGRFEDLQRLYATRYPRKRPTKADDKSSWSQMLIVPPGPSERHIDVSYAPDAAEVKPDSPWRHVHLLPVVSDDGVVPEFSARQRVAWAVATHRALVAQPSLALTPSPLVTGRYPSFSPDRWPDGSMRRHANRVAIQLLPPSCVPSRHDTGGHAYIAVMVPVDADPQEQGLVAAALTELRSVYAGRLGKLLVVDDRRRVDAADFWDPVPDGHRRLWRGSPAIVPENRPMRDADGRRWTFEDSGLLSVGFLLRDRAEFADIPRGAEGYRQLRTAVRECGVRVRDTVVERHRPEDFVHKLPRGAVAQPYRAWIDLAGLVPQQALTAVGQTRHLGGGLLRPIDVPADVAAEWLAVRS